MLHFVITAKHLRIFLNISLLADRFLRMKVIIGKGFVIPKQVFFLLVLTDEQFLFKKRKICIYVLFLTCTVLIFTGHS